MPPKGAPVGDGDPELATVIAALADNKAEYTRVDLQFKRMGDDALTAVLAPLAKNNTLQQLFLSNNELSALSAKALGGMISKNKGIKELSLGRNSLGDASVGEIAKALSSNSTIEVFCMGENRLTASGSTQLVEVLQSKATSGNFKYEVFIEGGFLRSDPPPGEANDGGEGAA